VADSLKFRDTRSYSIWKAGKGDRFSVAARGFERPVIGYIFSNDNGTWSLDYKGQKLRGTYDTIDQAATAIVALASGRPVAQAQRQKRSTKK
jgi:hypothetical protein